MKRLQTTEKQSSRKKQGIPAIGKKVKIRKMRALKLMILFKSFPGDNSKILYCNTTLLDVAEPGKRRRNFRGRISKPEETPHSTEGSRQECEKAITNPKQEQQMTVLLNAAEEKKSSTSSG